MKKLKYFFIVLFVLYFTFPFVYRYLIVPENYPIGIWTCEEPYLEINFMEGPTSLDEMTGTILVEGEEYTFEAVDMNVHPGQARDNMISFGKYVTKEIEFESGAETVVHTNVEFETEFSIYYEIKRGELVAYVQYSEFEDYPRETEFKFTTNQDDKFTRYP